MSVSATINGSSTPIPTDGDTDWGAAFVTLMQAVVGLSATVFQFAAASGLTTSAVYLRPGMAAADSTEVFLTAPRAGKLSTLYLKATSAPVGGTVTVTVRKNGLDTSLLATIALLGTTASDTSNTVTVAAGDTISVKGLGNAGYGSGCANLTACFAYTPS